MSARRWEAQVQSKKPNILNYDMAVTYCTILKVTTRKATESTKRPGHGLNPT